MIRILHIVSSLTIGSGVMSFIMNYYRHIDKSKIQFDFLFFEQDTFKQKNYIDEIKELGGKVFYLEKPSLKNLYKTYTEFNRFFRERQNEYKIIHLHEVYLVHFIKIFAVKYGIKHLITHAHTTKYSDNPKSALRNRIMCLGLKYSANHYFACSIAAGRFYYGDKAVESGNVQIINNAIDLEKYKFNKTIRKRMREELELENNFVIGNIGRMAPQKNQMFLINVFSEIVKQKSDARLVIIGDGPLRNQIEEYIKQLGLQDKIKLLGIRNDVPQLLMAMDVFCLPSLFEGLGIVAVEAQITGLNCVLSNTVPKEVVVSNLVEFMNLKDSSEQWAKLIINLKININNRSNIKNKIMNKEYDISLETYKLENIYNNLYFN